MDINELIEKKVNEYPEELYTHSYILREFAIELLEMVRSEGRVYSCPDGSGYAIDKALEELRK